MSADTMDEGGGQAFPSDCSWGLTLRDYFAAKAMQAMVGNFRVMNHGDDVTTTEQHREMMLDTNSKTGEHEGAAEIAADAYTIADAMIAARKEDK